MVDVVNNLDKDFTNGFTCADRRYKFHEDKINRYSTALYKRINECYLLSKKEALANSRDVAESLKVVERTILAKIDLTNNAFETRIFAKCKDFCAHANRTLHATTKRDTLETFKDQFELRTHIP